MTDPTHSEDEVVTGELVDGGQDTTSGEGAPQEEDDDGAREEIDQPTRLLRIAGMVKGLLQEVETTDLDEAARDRLTKIHRRALDMLADVMSDDLTDELERVAPEFTDDLPSGAELRVAQAQLAGWLEGLFHGIQASMATRKLQRAAPQLQKAMQQQAQGQEGGDGSGGTGQYL
ncbi:MAG: proteasome activator [Nitriliruptorales bacterium]|nr:proteasome activator [Nitriliruptorales bacterium]